MGDRILLNYFPILKFICMLAISAYTIVNGQTDDSHLSSQVCLIALILLSATAYESFIRYKWLWLLAEGLLLSVTYLYFNPECFYLAPFLVLDAVVYLNLKWPLLLFPMIGCFFSYHNRPFYFFCSLFGAVIYLQHYIFLKQYRERMEYYEKEEYELKDTIDNHEIKLKEELRANGLYYEKLMLEDKTRLAQVLHDELGHSINGSIYQLEACKVLLDKEKEKCNSIIQNVIDSLRISMEEIRMILRKEKPNKKQMAMVQLHALSEECKERYGIDMELSIQGDAGKISDKLWEIILDNTFEAVTNALKYAKCSHIKIEICVMNKLVRCSICDDGKGCDKFETGMGMEGMKRRTRSVNGTIDFEMTNGFTVKMLLPAEEQQA
ncbi:signal transduction histidine kinase [Kineothrix alysoides]|uniref:histidine kinase n=1 Tax=Kineothrix alysoides TaxID=1469948 RepID=A0A4R1R4X0_9FIRM|nr:histidine kinase [Kineothrix alysoides]TCL60460.1 signal transduction histidine kinase [Kineothrix alysoides]